jgi:predicted GNAT family acetyltransferase
MLSNPFWFALRTEHAHFAVGKDPVMRYPADVIPFAGLHQYSAEQLLVLRHLLAPEERIFVAVDQIPEIDGLVQVSHLSGLQLHFKGTYPQVHPEGIEVQRLGPDDAPAMVSLTDLAFPGFFRERTYELGSYFGIFRNRELVAMAGERLALPGFREISAVCTHPEHTGNGYATALIRHLLCIHTECGLLPPRCQREQACDRPV